MSELKSCPFCGAEFYKEDDDGWLRIDHKPDCYFSDCTTDSWSIQERNIWFFDHWNTRHERTCEGCKHVASRTSMPPVCETCRRAWNDNYEEVG